MSLSSESKIFILIGVITVLVVGIGVALMSKPPIKLEKSQLILADSHTKGNKEAKTYLVEFSDLQCPACKAYYPEVKKIIETNKDKLLFAYRHFPLEQHKFAESAALAVEAAAEQDKFWEMHDYIFENQDSLSEEFLLGAWEKLGLDKTKYEKAFKEKTYQSSVNTDKADGNQFGVNSTPTFFLNGEKLNLINQKDLEAAVAKALKDNK